MKRFGLCALVCLAVLAFCVRPFPVFAQSGNSTCTVTADAREPEPTQEPGAEERPEPGEPDDKPGDEADPGTTEAPGEGEPDAGKDTETTKDPGEGEGTPESGKKPVPTKRPAESNPAKEPGKGGAGSMPGTGEDSDSGEEPGRSDTSPEAEKTSTATPEPEKDSGEDGNRNHPDLLSFIIAVLLGIVVLLIGAMAVGALFPYLWMFLLFYFCRRSRKRFHGILTDEDNRFIRLENVTVGARAVQDIIDETGSLRECVAEILKEETITCIPKQSRMVFVYSDRQGGTVSREEDADEAEMFRILEELEGTGQVKVWIRCRRAGIDIPLEFWV